jgi:aspartyl-tRNA(Asn)/glutamyl-tRNA(Gln) amidotransferase subunit A
MKEAAIVASEIEKRGYRGPLHGIPIGLKDLFDTAGIRTTAQSKVLEHRVPDRDATVVSKLRQSGAILLGKLAMHEFALGSPTKSLFKPARNPWCTDRIPGGSSSGSAAAVAAGLCMGALGSDTMGSIRGPAALCGIVGLKPTYGRVSRSGVLPLSWTLDHCGPMTWTVEDSAIMLEVIAGHDPKDQTSSSVKVPPYSSLIADMPRGIRVGVLRSYIIDAQEKMDPEALSNFEDALRVMASIGATINEVEILSLRSGDAANTVIMLAEAFSYHRKNLQLQPENFGHSVRTRFYTGGLFTSADYLHAQQVRAQIQHQTQDLLQTVDVLILPGSRSPAPEFSAFDPLATSLQGGFMSLANLTGFPAINVPSGFNSIGLPLSIQMIGRAFDEPTILRLAHAYEYATKANKNRRPDL